MPLPWIHYQLPRNLYHLHISFIVSFGRFSLISNSSKALTQSDNEEAVREWGKEIIISEGFERTRGPTYILVELMLWNSNIQNSEKKAQNLMLPPISTDGVSVSGKYFAILVSQRYSPSTFQPPRETYPPHLSIRFENDPQIWEKNSIFKLRLRNFSRTHPRNHSKKDNFQFWNKFKSRAKTDLNRKSIRRVDVFDEYFWIWGKSREE